MVLPEVGDLLRAAAREIGRGALAGAIAGWTGGPGSPDPCPPCPALPDCNLVCAPCAPAVACPPAPTCPEPEWLLGLVVALGGCILSGAAGA